MNKVTQVNVGSVAATSFPGSIFFLPLSRSRGREEERPWERGWCSSSRKLLMSLALCVQQLYCCQGYGHCLYSMSYCSINQQYWTLQGLLHPQGVSKHLAQLCTASVLMPCCQESMRRINPTVFNYLFTKSLDWHHGR